MSTNEVEVTAVKANAVSVRRVIEHVGNLLTDFRGAAALIAVGLPLLVMLVRTGIGFFPIGSINNFVQLTTAIPGAGHLPGGAQYLYNSMTGPFLAHFVGVDNSVDWIRFHIVMIIIGIVIMGLMAAHAAGRRFVGVLYATFAAASVSTVLLGWVGSYDIYTLIGLTVMALSRWGWIAIFGGIIVGTTNIEMGAAAFVALVVVGWADGRLQIWNAVGAAAGLIIGHGLLLWWQHSHGVSGSRLGYAEAYGIDKIWHLSTHSLPALAMTWMGAATLLVGWTWLHRVSNRWRIVVALVIAILPGMLALDETRVSAVVVWPVVAWLVARSFKKMPGPTSAAAAATLIVALVVPPVFMWEGAVHVVTWFPQIVAATK